MNLDEEQAICEAASTFPLPPLELTAADVVFIEHACMNYPTAIRKLIAIRELCEPMNTAARNPETHRLAANILNVLKGG